CETRPGPEYILRSYTFNSDGGYSLIQHHYWDDSCSSPKLSVISYGRIQLRNSLVQPEASNGMAKPTNITVIPQDSAAAHELDTLVSRECPGQYWKSWKHNEEHLVYDNKQERRGTFNLWSHSYQPITNHHPLNKPIQVQISGDISCLGSLKWAFNELKLLKIQLRPIIHNYRKYLRHVEMELLLGDIHTNKKRREFYSPTSFQVPLLRLTKEENITVHKHQFLVKTSNAIPTNLITNIKTPPHLIEKPHLPPYIWGEWTSTRCEIRPLDVYLLRHFSFYENDFRYDIVKVEMDYKGSWLLFLGQADTNNLPTTANERPTAFQLPLVKCGEVVGFSENLNERLERKFFFGS
ncbi:APCDD1-like, partial [Asbolus verrucosus]